MAGSGFRLAYRINPDELDRSGTNIPDPGPTRWESTQPFNVGPLRPSKGTHDDERETTNVGAESPQTVDADDFRTGWEGIGPYGGEWPLETDGQGTRVNQRRRYNRFSSSPQGMHAILRL